MLGHELGVAITGSENLGLTLVLTEGFGRIRMSDRAWDLLGARAGRLASVSGATQIRAGVLRPEVLIPESDPGTAPVERDTGAGLALGSLVRVIRAPHFGRVGQVVELPSELRKLETEAMVRVLVVAFREDGARAAGPSRQRGDHRLVSRASPKSLTGRAGRLRLSAPACPFAAGRGLGPARATRRSP